MNEKGITKVIVSPQRVVGGPNSPVLVESRAGSLPELPAIVHFDSEKVEARIPSLLDMIERYIENGRILPKHVLIEFDVLKVEMMALLGFGLSQCHYLSGRVPFHPDFVELGITGGSVLKEITKPFQGSIAEFRTHMRHKGHMFPSTEAHEAFIKDLNEVRTSMTTEYENIKNDEGRSKDMKSFDAKWEGMTKSFILHTPVLKYGASGKEEKVSFKVNIRLSSDNGNVTVWLESTEAVDAILAQAEKLRNHVETRVRQINREDVETSPKVDTTVQDLFTEDPAVKESVIEDGDASLDPTIKDIPSEYNRRLGKVTLVLK